MLLRLQITNYAYISKVLLFKGFTDSVISINSIDVDRYDTYLEHTIIKEPFKIFIFTKNYKRII